MLPGTKSRTFFRSQGLLAPEILVTLANHQASDSDALPDALVEFCNWCIEEAWLVRDEVQPSAWPIYHASYYIAQVNNGGHGQFAANSAMQIEVLGDVALGLERLGLNDLLAIFRRFRSALERDAALKTSAMEGAGFGEGAAFIRELDDAFFASSDPKRFSRQASNWLKDAVTVLPLTPRELRARQAKIIASNNLLLARRSASLRRPPWGRFKQAAARLWGKTGIRRPGETVLDQLRRRVAENPPPEWQAGDALGQLIIALPTAVQDGDDAQVDRIFAEFRNIHARFSLEKANRWPHDIRMYASKLHYAGERLGRPDLLAQAAEAFGRSIATGAVYSSDPGFDWRSLGQALVALARLRQSYLPGLTDAVDAFAKAYIMDAERPDLHSSHVRTILGRAEAHLVLAANTGGGVHLDAARDALAEARPLLTKDNRNEWGVINAEQLSLRPRADVARRDRDQAVRQLDLAIAWEEKNDGEPRANPMRLKHLRQLRAVIAEV